VTVTLGGDIGTTGNNPAKFRAPAGSLRASLQIDPPFTRLLERNNYRQQLVDYTSDRRTYIQFMDSVHAALRNILRNLAQLQTNLEIQRRAVAISIRRVDLTRENLSAPRPPGETLGPTAALDLLNALSDLRNTQNNFMSVWLNHYATRMILERDLGIMQLDDKGRWLEQPGALTVPSDVEELELPPPVPTSLIEELNKAAAAMEVEL
jgi:outer membrane protein TolC